MSAFLRKGLHALLAVSVAFAGPYLGVGGTVALGCMLAGVFLAALLMRRFNKLRVAERGSYGEFFFALGVGATALLALPHLAGAFRAGILILAFADPLAALIGRQFGTHPYRVFGERRTYEGSLACTLACACILLAHQVTLPLAGMGGLVLALVEAFTPRGSDNLFLPIVGSAWVLAWA